MLVELVIATVNGSFLLMVLVVWKVQECYRGFRMEILENRQCEAAFYRSLGRRECSIVRLAWKALVRLRVPHLCLLVLDEGYEGREKTR